MTATFDTKTFDEIQEHSLSLVRQSQEAVVEGVRAWSEAFASFAPAWQPTGWPVRPEEAVDAVFDIAEQTLATQRQVAHQVWGATATLTETVAEQTQSVGTQAAEQTQSVGMQAAETRTPAQPASGNKGKDKDKDKDKDYESLTVEQLQDEAAKAGLEGRSQMNKQELVKGLRKHG